jgi:hypothetical protein
MTDYGREVRFGYFLIPNAADPLLSTAQQAEQLGLDYIGVQDHPYQRRFGDTWTLLSMIAAITARVGVFPTWPTCRCARRRCWPRPPPAWTCSAAAGWSSG